MVSKLPLHSLYGLGNCCVEILCKTKFDINPGAMSTPCPRKAIAKKRVIVPCPVVLVTWLKIIQTTDKHLLIRITLGKSVRLYLSKTSETYCKPPSVTKELALHTVTAGNGNESLSATFIVVTTSYLKKFIMFLNPFEKRNKIIHIIRTVMYLVRNMFGKPCMDISKKRLKFKWNQYPTKK
ncbi:hypothetical protein BpHYR1_001119 [Brachionus plicatilis]|uniref:Uncharacterized protein n=1 Tax=Brachionus plicatilis TaxID=10195 RepID=A0A3M7P0V3_BRAPC|nr:hypothetical protein BpHYR1_001119 [Brachionus plicatilis]